MTNLEQGLVSESPEASNIIQLLQTKGDDDQAKKARDKARHLLMDGASEFHEFAVVAEALLDNFKDLRPNVHDRFVKICEYGEISTYFNAVLLIRKNVDNPEFVGKHDRGCHDLITWAETPDEWGIVAKELLSSVANLHDGVYKHFVDDCPPDVKETFNSEMVFKLTKVLEEVERWDKPEIVRMHKLIDILGETDAVKELFVNFRNIWGVLPKSIATRLDMPRGNEGDSDDKVGFESFPPSFLSKSVLKPHKSLEEWEAEGWTIHQDSGRQMVIKRGDEFKTIHRPKVKKTRVAKARVVKDKKAAGKSKGNK